MSRRLDRLNQEAIVIALAELTLEATTAMQTLLPDANDLQVEAGIAIIDEEVQYTVTVTSLAGIHTIPSQWQDIAEALEVELANAGFRHPIAVNLTAPIVVAQEMPQLPAAPSPTFIEEEEVDATEFDLEEDEDPDEDEDEEV